ncbi:organic cation transporter 1-like [Musca vetustissima]|uniref:organic cation transporter 1-like n=1 Tax=Musca vetustissima TaxID=27455 RepID=UPI002AB6F223|nr:organic cation transporter 1-like [Musca vetustissima]
MADRPADFETAIKACGFGRFNIFLLMAGLPVVLAACFASAVISYILPSAECDLNLDLLDKGILNAITYCGMIISAMGWGYLADKKGRRNLLICGHLLDVICVLCAAMSQSRTQLMIAKFFSGIVMCGPFAILVSYLSEFHGSHFRMRIMMIVGIMISIATLTMPLLAIVVLPADWNFQIFNMNFVAWKVYLAVCGLPSLLSSVIFGFFPESPRFLISQGRNTEALEVFRKMYAANTGKSKDTYPIQELIKEIKQKDEGSLNKIQVATIEANTKDICNEGNPEMGTNNVKDATLMDKQPNIFKTLCSRQYLGLSIQVCLIEFFIMIGQNTLRLWLPQLFASLNEYEQISNESTSMCTIFEYSVNKTNLMKNSTDECVVIITPSSYTNNIIVGCVGFIIYLAAGTLITAIGNKRIQVIGLTVAGSCGIALYWSSTSLTTLILTSTYSALGSMSASSAIGSSVNLFPTSLRTMIVSLTLMIGRIGSIAGNVVFPIFMSFGCIPPIAMIGIVLYLGCLLCAFLPNSNKVELK